MPHRAATARDRSLSAAQKSPGRPDTCPPRGRCTPDGPGGAWTGAAIGPAGRLVRSPRPAASLAIGLGARIRRRFAVGRAISITIDPSSRDAAHRGKPAARPSRSNFRETQGHLRPTLSQFLPHIDACCPRSPSAGAIEAHLTFLVRLAPFSDQFSNQRYLPSHHFIRRPIKPVRSETRQLSYDWH